MKYHFQAHLGTTEKQLAKPVIIVIRYDGYPFFKKDLLKASAWVGMCAERYKYSTEWLDSRTAVKFQGLVLAGGYPWNLQVIRIVVRKRGIGICPI